MMLVIIITVCPGTPISNIENVLSVIESDVSPSLTHIKRSLSELRRCLHGIVNLYLQYYEGLDGTFSAQSSFHYVTPVQHSLRRGCPSYVVSREQLEYLRSLSFSSANAH